MPIYEYQCEACSHKLEKLQKISDAPLVDCPKCDRPALKKLVSAVAFRLKGGGWYETDFKTGNKKNVTGSDGGSSGDSGGSSTDSAAASGSGTSTESSGSGSGGDTRESKDSKSSKDSKGSKDSNSKGSKDGGGGSTKAAAS